MTPLWRNTLVRSVDPLVAFHLWNASGVPLASHRAALCSPAWIEDRSGPPIRPPLSYIHCGGRARRVAKRAHAPRGPYEVEWLSLVRGMHRTRIGRWRPGLAHADRAMTAW